MTRSTQLHSSFRLIALLALLSATLFFLQSCSQGASAPEPSASSTAKLTLQFPAGYSYDRSSKGISTPLGQHAASLPPYVTGITLTISGEDMEPLVYEVDLATMSVTFSITPGLRTFSLVVNTNIGLTFTDSVTVEVVSGAPLNLEFNLVVNAPPSITSVTANPTTAAPGDVITLSCSATDPDPEDNLTYKWSAPDGWSANGKDATYTIPAYGAYIFTCTVSDGWGGLASATVVVDAPNPNQPPVIIAAKVREPITKAILSYSPVGLPVELFCSATDANGDPLTYKWSGPMGAVPGAVYIYTPTVAGNHTFTCTVSDGINPPVSASVTLLSKFETIMNSDVYFTDEWQVNGTVGDAIDVNCKITPAFGVKLGITLGSFCSPPPSPISTTGTLVWTIGASPFKFDIYGMPLLPGTVFYSCVMKSMKPTTAALVADASFCAF